MTTLRLHNFVENIELSATLYGIVQRLESAAAKVLKTLAIWASRSEDRRQLATMSDHILADIGLTRSEVAVEISKFFWQR